MQRNQVVNVDEVRSWLKCLLQDLGFSEKQARKQAFSYTIDVTRAVVHALIKDVMRERKLYKEKSNDLQRQLDDAAQTDLFSFKASTTAPRE